MKKWLCVALAVAVLAGCAAKSPAPGSAVVYEITVSYFDQDTQILHRYTSQYKMRQILNHLRTLGQKYRPAMDPDTMRTIIFEVRLSFSNGSQRTYHTRDDRYIRTDHGPWQQTDPVRLQALNALLLQLPPDKESPL